MLPLELGGVGGYEGEEVVDVPGSEETEKSQRRALEEFAARRRSRDEGGVIVLEDSDDEAPPPTKPVRQGDPGQGCSKDGAIMKEEEPQSLPRR